MLPDQVGLFKVGQSLASQSDPSPLIHPTNPGSDAIRPEEQTKHGEHSLPCEGDSSKT